MEYNYVVRILMCSLQNQMSKRGSLFSEFKGFVLKIMIIGNT